MDQRKGFHTVRDFIDNPTMESSGLMPIKDYVAARLKGEEPEVGTPLHVADLLDRHATAALAGVAAVRQRAPKPSKDLRRTLGDIEAMACLGHYYASKIRGATELALFEATARSDRKDTAVACLEEAVAYWQLYAKVATRQYRPQLLARTRVLDWEALAEEVKKDVAIARSAESK